MYKKANDKQDKHEERNDEPNLNFSEPATLW